MSTDPSFEKKLKQNLTTKTKFYTTSEFISSGISFEKILKNFTTKMKLHATSEFISNDTSFEKVLTTINHFQSIHNSNVIKSVYFWMK